MASYNLKNLDGLKKNDTVIYNKSTEISFYGYKIKVSLYGKASRSFLKGGYAEFIIDCRNLKEKFYYNKSDGWLSYKENSKNFVIGIPGNSGYGLTYSEVQRMASTSNGYYGFNRFSPSNGGGLVGDYGSWEVSPPEESPKSTPTPGNQASDGKNASVTIAWTKGDTFSGGAGWYKGGDGGNYTRNSDHYILSIGSAGGSGFVLGYDGTSYPSTYMGNDTDLISILKNVITNSNLIQGSSSKDECEMHITVLSAPAIKVRSNDLWHYCFLKYYDGIDFKKCLVKYYNGNKWIDIGG